MRYYWEQQNDSDPSGFLAMTSVLRLHQLMTTAVDHRLRTEFNISLTDYQILKVLQLSDTRHLAAEQGGVASDGARPPR